DERREGRTLRWITHHSRLRTRARKAIFEPLRHASHARTGMARLPTSPIIFTTKPRRACWLQPDTPRTSKSLRAAIIRAPFALFRSCVESFARGVLNR